jgi:long-chain acyl-CoA synthetase
VLSRVVERASAHRLTLLIRGRDDAAVQQRLQELRRYVERWRPGLDLSRVAAVRADITQPGLGLAPETSEELCQGVTHIVHSAATIRLNQPLAQARATNVSGTEAMLAFAERCPSLVRLAHISTAYVAGDRSGVISEDELDCGQAFLNDYERSKFEAELRVRQRMADLPITIIRPSIIVGDSRDGHASSLSTIFPILRHVASGRLRRFPGHGSTPLDLVPVDYVADAIVRLSWAEESEGGTFHVTAGGDRCITVRRLFELTIRKFGGNAERALGFDGERPTPREGPDRRLMERLQCYFEYLFTNKAFDNSRCRSVLGAHAGRCPDPQSYLPRVLSFAWQTPAWTA